MKTVGEKEVRTRAEYQSLIDKLYKEGYTWCDGDSLKKEYNPECRYPFLVRMLDNKTIYWSEPGEPLAEDT